MSTISASKLLSVANENFVASYRKLVEHSPEGEVNQVGGVFAFVTGFPFALFNGCVVVERAAPPELEEALAWVTAHGVPHRVWLAEQAAQKLEAVPTAYGLGRDPASFPGMVLHPVPEPPPPAVGVTVESVDAQDLGSLHHVAVESGLAPELASQMYPPSLATDGDVCLFVGRLDARPVASSLAIRSREASGVYAVGTLADARRRGVGTAMTWAAVDAGRAWGYDSIVLQSSEMALPMYEAMGFRTIVRYVTFSQPAPDHAKFAQPQEGGEFAPTASPIGHETPVPPRPQ